MAKKKKKTRPKNEGKVSMSRDFQKVFTFLESMGPMNGLEVQEFA